MVTDGARQRAVFGDGIAVVTGAGSGIGAALGRHLGGLGSTVVLADLDGPAVRRVADEIVGSGGRAVAHEVDVRDADAVAGLADWIAGELGPVRLLINNAGIEQFGYLWDVAPADWRRTVDVNITGVYHGVRAFLPRMMADPGRSHLLNVASVGAVTSVPLQAPYVATKHAVLGLTECLYQEVAEVGADVAVAVVLPGAVTSAIFDSAHGVTSGDVEAAERHRRAMFAVRERAIGAAEAADTIIEQAAQGEFFIVTQPEIVHAAMDARAERLRARSAPAPYRSRFVGDGR